MDWRKLLLEVDGRIRRRDFWIGFAVVMPVSILCNLIPKVGLLLGLLTVWPMICLHAKRLHDMGRSAWLMLVPPAFTVCASLAAGLLGLRLASGPGVITPALLSLSHGISVALIASGLSLAVESAFVLWVGLTPGERGLNRFDPAEEMDADLSPPV
jgi:uncharacterized membrane protein YhaH (DUF805 family)